ncbi:MAG: RNA polymerase sigma factor [Actinobacteria bacterium]|nr:RNA polymerase sigma factor [Actinomycetota bacterium]MCA1720800.1 RNA polymerase sigma factor [Actinomycetota bacterium]
MDRVEDEAAAAARLLIHWPAMVGACARVLDSREQAEDCASEALLAVLTGGGLKDVRNEQAWLVRIAKRRAADELRREDRVRRRAVRLAGQTDRRPHDAAAEAVLDQAEARWLGRQVDELLPTAGADVVRAVADGLTVAEAAQRLGMTKRAAESHLHRARGTLRAAWTATLGVVGWVLAGLRRAAPAVPAAVLAAVLLVDPAPHPAGAAPASPVPRPLRASETHAPPSAARAGATPPAAAPPVQSSAAARRLVPAGVGRTSGKQPRRRLVGGGPAGGVVLTAQDRPSPADPVGLVVWCVGHASVSLQHVGC